jgi:hypothetical protein
MGYSSVPELQQGGCWRGSESGIVLGIEVEDQGLEPQGARGFTGKGHRAEG